MLTLSVGYYLFMEAGCLAIPSKRRLSFSPRFLFVNTLRVWTIIFIITTNNTNMAIINCPECGREVSDQSKKCPHCGYTLKKSSINFNWKFLVLGLVFFGITLCFVCYYYGHSYYDRASDAVNATTCIMFAITGLVACVCAFKNLKELKILLIIGVILSCCSLIYWFVDKNNNWYKYLESENELNRQKTEKYLEEQEKNFEEEQEEDVTCVFGTYEFSDDFNTWAITLNDDETCTIINKSKDGAVSYGSWFHLGKEHIFYLNFVDLVPMVWFEGDGGYTEMEHPVFDAQSLYIYKDSHSADAKNPKKRLKMSKTQ